MLAAGVLLWSGTPDAPRFLLLKNRKHHTWGFPKGHLEAEEGMLDGALREVEEETGIRLESKDLVPAFSDSHLYKVRGRGTAKGTKVWKRVVLFLAAEAVDEAQLQLSPEHKKLAWLGLPKALSKLEHEALRRSLLRAVDTLRLLAKT